MQSLNLKEKNSNNKNDDKSWECFRNFVNVHMWDGFVYLFIVVCDSEKELDCLKGDFDEMRNRIYYLYSNGGTGEDKYNTTNEIMDQYVRSRFKKNEELRNKVMISVFRQLESHNVYDPSLSDMIHLFDKMSRFQLKSLRNMFISRIYGYSKFSEYLYKSWSKKYYTKNKIYEDFRPEDKKVKQKVYQNIDDTENKKDDDSHQEDKKVNAKEQNVDQNIDQNKSKNYTENKKDVGSYQEDKKVNTNEQRVGQNIDHDTENKKGEDFHQENKKVTVEEQKVDQNVDQNKSKLLKANESKSEHEENNTQDQSMEEKKHDYKETTSSSSTNKISKKGSKSKNKTLTKSTKSIASDNTIEKKSKGTQKRAFKVEKLQQEIETLQENQINEVEKLQQEIEALRKEAANHQAALGGIMNVGWRDNDSNNSMQLTRDIEKLQKDLDNFTRVKRSGIEIKIDAANRLFEDYGCKLSQEKNNIKLILGAVLQQHLIKIILESADSYFQQIFNNNIEKDQENDSTSCIIDDKLEAVILSGIKELIKLTTRFGEVRTGTDGHSRILPTKLRQQIYAALGHRGFAKSDHPFITQLTKNIMDEMNKYRIIESADKNSKLEKEIITIIFQVIRIFYFRLHTQEPVPSWEFYKSGDCFDPDVMNQIGQSNEGELEVEICSFPVVALIKNLDDEAKRVFTKAQVIVRPKK
ncbi:hypothetical protein RhiirA1_438416 [Rhizophagus irregularis]|uniref:Uncharacterized protein n=1 Tax=Rhizophagus irregularis TaxID=588596 RepID=A0A2N0S9F9_9GLOM|nr:hypothetical protein RhiirA1_438416 [Rhizophagus irregularis]CAB4494382.1 unnamed protein product [Rhizophagus irregularis]